jgi:bisphosphoglycerate-dependent phosphoglycerate mutase
MARPLAPMTAKIENFIRMEARGESADDILREIFHIDPDNCDPKVKANAYQQMYRWRHRPDADAIWQDELKATVRRRVPYAMSRILRQIDSDTEWLANKAANDVMLLAGKVGIVKNEETALKVEISGMPDLGSPDDENA